MTFLIILAWYIPCSGGAGVSLPYNLTFFLWLGVVLAARVPHRVWCTAAYRQPVMAAGGALLCLPWCFQAQDSHEVVILLLAVGASFLLNRLVFSPVTRRTFLLAIFLLALCQNGIALIQTFLPHLAMQRYAYDWLLNHGRPYGIFQQVNLLASVVATGAGCGWLLLLTERHRLRAALLTAGLSVLVCVVALNQSRAGAIGTLLVTLALIALMGNRHPRRVLIAGLIVALAALAGWYTTRHVTVLINGEPYRMAREYGGSTRERWHILTITWQMIREKPWLGWGYGTFEYAFSRWILLHPERGPMPLTVITHPHNELLYMWFQGGVSALAGMLLLFTGWVQRVMRAWRQGREHAGYAVLIIPLLVHLNLEYPFYQSYIHLGLFVVLLRLSISDTCAGQWRPVPVPMRIACGVSGMALAAFSLSGLYANHQLTALERDHLTHFPHPAPWYFVTQGERAQFDEKVALLMQYNQTRNPATLDAFMTWAEAWSRRHNDKNVWRSMIMIAQFRGEQARAAQMTRIYQQLFPALPAEHKQKHRP